MGDILKTGYLKYSQKKVLKSTWSKKFFALITKTKRGICFVGFQNEEIFKRYEAEVQNADASKFEKCTKNYSQIVIPNIQCLNKVSLKDQDAMETMTDSGKKYLLLCEQYGNNYVDRWVIKYQFASSQNTLASIGSGRGPADDWSSNENDLYESKDEGVAFQVLIIETEATSRLDLTGHYNLQVNSRNLTLVEQKTKRQVFVWPYKYLRRYGRTSSEFSFEAGRRCESGEGLFKFCTLKGNEIFEIVEGMATAIREKERQSNSGGSSQGGRSPPPVSNLPRPSSLRNNFQHTQSLTFDNGIGVNSTHVANTNVYSEPFKMTGWRGSVKKKEDLTRQMSAPHLAPGSVYHLAAAESSSLPVQDNSDIDCTYSMVGQKASKAPAEKVAGIGYENVNIAPPAAGYENVDMRPPVPPKLMDSPSASASRASVMSEKLKVEKMEHPEDDADYADPDDLGEPAYAYACAEDVKRDLSWMKKPEPGEVKFQVESTGDEVDYYHDDY